MKLQQLLDRIADTVGREPKKYPSGYGCLCPAHQDRNPSLIVSETDEGKLSVHCFAGCSFWDICDSLKINPTDLKEAEEETPEERERRIKRNEAEKKARQDALEKAQDVWGKAKTDNHPYLERKKVEPFGTRVQDGKLLVPVFSPGGSLVSYQSIDQDGTKKNAFGCSMNGFFVLKEPSKNSRIIIAEGFATAASIQMALEKDSVVCAFGLSKISSVYEFYTTFDPEREIVVAGDKGATYGNLPVIYPDLKEGNDFNDLHVKEGLDAVREQLKNRRYRPRSLESVFTKPPPPIDWVFENFLYTHSLNIIYAAEGQGKTRFAYEICYSLICGKNFVDFPCKKSRSVLLLDGEMSRSEFYDYLVSLLERSNEGGKEVIPQKPFDSIFKEDIEEGGLDYINLNHNVCRKSLEPIIDKYDVIVFDNYFTLTTDTGTEHHGKRDLENQGLARWFGRLKRKGKTLILITHSNKKGEIRGDMGMFTIDCQSLIRINGTETGGFKVKTEKNRRVLPKHKKTFTIEIDKMSNKFGKLKKQGDSYDGTNNQRNKW